DPVVGLELGLEDERVATVRAPRPPEPARGGDQPAPVLPRAEERREAGARVEARHAEPVDRAVAADQRSGVVVADERVVLDPERHGPRLAVTHGRPPSARTSPPASAAPAASPGRSIERRRSPS